VEEILNCMERNLLIKILKPGWILDICIFKNFCKKITMSHHFTSDIPF
jgi:hypothetical protein